MIDRAELKRRMGGSGEVEMTDPQLDALIAIVTGQWEAITGRPWLRRSAYVQEFSTTIAPGWLHLELDPVDTIATVREWQYVNGALTLVTLTAGEHLMLPRGLQRVDSTSGTLSRWKPYGVEITYSGGYHPIVSPGATQVDTPATPHDIAEALYTQARFVSARTDHQRLTIAEQLSIDGESGRFLPAHYHPLFKETADRHRPIAI